jgi:hypothetical protein
MSDDRWKKVVFAADLPQCECCEETWCPECEEHYADCSCIGPTEEDVEYEERDGVLYGRRVAPVDS